MESSAANLEIWKEIPGTRGFYEVSSIGNVRSWYVQGRTERAKEPRKCRLNKSGKNQYVRLGLRVGTKTIYLRLHQTVCFAFYGKPGPGMEVAHLNGIKTDNRLENLKYVSSKENKSHKKSHGTHLSGSKHPMAKISEADAEAIRSLYSIGMYQRQIGNILGIKQQQVSRILAGKRWSFLTSAPSGAQI